MCVCDERFGLEGCGSRTSKDAQDAEAAQRRNVSPPGLIRMAVTPSRTI